MTAILLSTAIRVFVVVMFVVVAFIVPPTRTLDEHIDDRIEQYLHGGWTLCGDAEAMARVDRILKRMSESAGLR